MQNNNLIYTLLYFDIFGYPLTIDELHAYFIGEEVTKKDLKIRLKTQNFIIKNKGLYYLAGREILIPTRLMRKEFSDEKREKAKKMARFCARIPFVRAVALSGSVACNNARKKDDIDLFIITSKNRIWITRFLIYFFLKLSHNIRSKKVTENMFCPNMFVSENDFSITTKNLYTASEIIHLVPLLEKNNEFQDFFFQNKWVKEYFPNFSVEDPQKTVERVHENNSMFSIILNSVDSLLFFLQRILMSRKITNEYVTKDRIQFHPNDLSQQVLSMWDARKSAHFVSNGHSLIGDVGYFNENDLTPGS